MAAEIYQKIKTPLEVEKDRLSIQRQITELQNAENAAEKEYLRIEKELLDELKKRYAAARNLADLQGAAETRLERVATNMTKQTSPAAAKRLGALHDEIRASIRNYRLKRQIAAFEIEDQKDKLENERKIQAERSGQFETVQKFLGKFADIFNIQNKYYTLLRDSTNIHGKKLIQVASELALLEAMFVVFKQMDEGLAKFRIEMGMLRPDVKRLSSDIKDVAINFTAVGVTIDGARLATQALGAELGGVHVVSKDLIETTALMKAQLGVAEESSAGFLRNIAALSKTSAQAQRHMAYVAQRLTQAAGVPLNMVMQDVAKMSGNALAMVSRMPLQIVKTATEARRLGTSINKMADASAQLLNFHENIQAEMEASVLVGDSINLQLARELAYRRDVLGSTKAILSEARRIDFENLDYFQMQAFAAATGRSADELLKMVQAERQLREARGIDALKDEVAQLDRIRSLRESELNDSALQLENSVQQMANQERMVALQNQWNKLIMETMRVMYPVFDAMLKIAMIAIRIGPALTIIIPVLTWIGKYLSPLLTKLEQASGIIRFISATIQTIGGGLATAVKWIGAFFAKLLGFTGVFGKFAGFIGTFAKVIPVIGWIITGIQFIYHLFNEFGKVKWEGNIWKFILDGICAVGRAIRETLFRPFIDVYNWVMKWLGGHSPSVIGLSILKGIVSVSGKLFDALTHPWRVFLAWIFDKIPLMGGIAQKIRGGITGALENSNILEKKTTIGLNPAIVATEANPTAKTVATVEATKEQQTQKEQDSLVLGEILKSIKMLNDNLMAGKIGLYVDGQLLSATISRQTSFRGGYGVNSIVS